MNGNSFGRIFRLTTYGESHGPGLGGVLDGCPAGLPITEELLQAALDERRPGAWPTDADGPGGVYTGASPRKEADKIRLLSGVFNGLSTGAPIAFHVENMDARPQDYAEAATVFRPGHADFPLQMKYGGRDYRGGGRSSGRETLARVAAGAIAQSFLQAHGIELLAFTLEYGGLAATPENPPYAEISGPSRPFFAPNDAIVPLWSALAQEAAKTGDSLGGVARLMAFGLPAGLGEPVFDKLDARLAYAMLSVGAVKGVEFGSGFSAARSRGSLNNDAILPGKTGHIPAAFASNNSGGVLGGLSTGQPLLLDVAVKPIPSIAREQETLNNAFEPVKFSSHGRHDVSAIPRIVPVLKAMLALTLADFLLLLRCSRL